jgi:hypothetical protein
MQPSQGRRLTAEESLVLDYELSLKRFVDDAVPGSNEAFTMATNAIRWLILKEPGGLESARRWMAWVSGFKAPDSDAAMICRIEFAVRCAVQVRHGTGTFGEPKDAAKNFYEGLVAAFPGSSTLPGADEIQGWLDQHSARSRKGKVTTAGIVAKIVHRGKLLGARLSEQRTLERVTKALSHKRHPRW